jgi:hypothetical protein
MPTAINETIQDVLDHFEGFGRKAQVTPGQYDESKSRAHEDERAPCRERHPVSLEPSSEGEPYEC